MLASLHILTIKNGEVTLHHELLLLFLLMMIAGAASTTIRSK